MVKEAMISRVDEQAGSAPRVNVPTRSNGASAQIGLPEIFRVADFLDWYRDKRLILQPDFQRRAVWTQDIRSFLIDSILRGFPMPKVYLRSRTDLVSQKLVREVVGGQQRVRAIIDFATGDLRLNKRAKGFENLRYADLDDEAKSNFLNYAISVEHLANASDEFVLEVFSRLNTYSIPLNGAELRNANYNGEFKFSVRELARDLGTLWTKYGILSLRDRVRMLDDELTAELLGVIIDGVKGGGKPYVDELYSKYDKSLPKSEETVAQAKETIHLIDQKLHAALEAGVFNRSPQFLILFAAMCHYLSGIPAGDLKDALPSRIGVSIDWERANDNLLHLTEAVLSENVQGEYAEFVLKSRGATTKLPSRRTRFDFIWRALTT